MTAPFPLGLNDMLSEISKPYPNMLKKYHWFILLQISPTCASPALSNKDRFPRFFRTAPPELMSNPARIQLMHLFGWKRVSIMHQSYELMTLVGTKETLSFFQVTSYDLFTIALILGLIRKSCSLWLRLFYINIGVYFMMQTQYDMIL